MKFRGIGLKAISCKGVGSLALFQRPSLSVAVALDSGDGEGATPRHQQHRRQLKETPINRDGGENPEWDCPMLFDLLDDNGDDVGCGGDLLLEFELTNHGGLLFGDWIVGRVRVPLAELIAEAAIVGPAAFRFVSYQVLAPDGKPNGTLSFGFRMFDPDLLAPHPPPAIAPAVYHLPPSSATDSPLSYLPLSPPRSPAYTRPHSAYPPPPPLSLYSHISPEPSPRLYPPLSPPGQPSSFYPPHPAHPAFVYPPASEFYPPPPVYSPVTEGMQYHNNSFYPPSPAGAYAGCYLPENQPYGHRTDAYDRRLYG